MKLLPISTIELAQNMRYCCGTAKVEEETNLHRVRQLARAHWNVNDYIVYSKKEKLKDYTEDFFFTF